MNLLRSERTIVLLSALSLIVFIERVFLDFRYVALEMEAVQAYMPFTLPYMVAALPFFGGWIWALIAAARHWRAARVALMGYNIMGIVFAVGTMTTLCPLPCQTAWPVSDVLIIVQFVISVFAVLSILAGWSELARRRDNATVGAIRA